MSRIIKGGKVRFFSVEISQGQEEDFCPWQTFLPEEVWEEKNCESSETLEREENKEFSEKEDILEEKRQNISEKQEQDQKEIDPLSLPGVAERLSLLEQEAYEKGFAQGQKDGLEMGRKQYEILTSRLKDLLRSLETEIERQVLSLEKPLISLVKLMAEKVIHKEISIGPEVLKSCLQDALKYVVEQSKVRIHINPQDMGYIEDIFQELSKELSRLGGYEIVSDENVSRGGCLLETDFGIIDATYERKWREILEKLDER